MKELFGQYGGTVIAIVAALAVLGFLSGSRLQEPNGMWKAAGEAFGNQASQTLLFLGTGELNRFFQRALPVITYRKEAPVYFDSRIRLEDHFRVVDAEGRSLVPKIIGLLDAEGSCCSMERTGSGTYVVFDAPGAYRIFMEAEDSAGRSRVSAIWFPVQIP